MTTIQNGKMPAPEEVFTPATPISEAKYFAQRPHEEQRLVNALRELGAQVIVYGETGVGKTSLVQYILRQERRSYIRIQCNRDTTLGSIVNQVLDELREPRVMSQSRQVSGAAGASGGIPAILEASGTVTRTVATETTRWSSELTDKEFATTLQKRNVVLFVDDFEKVRAAEDKVRIANMMKAFSDLAPELPGIKIVLVGIATEAAALLHYDLSLQSRLHQIMVPRMSDAELKSILEIGFGALRIEASSAVKSKIVYLSNGYPKFVHQIGKEVAIVCSRAGSRDVDQSQLGEGISNAAMRLQATYQQLYETTTRSRARSKAIHKKLVDAAALLDSDEFSPTDLIEPMKEHGIEYSQFIGQLGTLTEPGRGAVLISPRYGAYRFADPMFKAYIRLLLSDQG